MSAALPDSLRRSTSPACLTERFPQEKEKIFVLPLEIPDPFGEDEEAYRACAERLRDALRMLL